MRFEGTLKSWNDERGFGFIAPAQGGQELFVHIKSFPAGTGRPVPGLVLSFTVEVGHDGKKRAQAVQFLRPAGKAAALRREKSSPWSLPRQLAIPLLLLCYVFGVIRFGFQPLVVGAYLLMSCIAFLAYTVDKSAAIRGRWRIPESTLHLLALAGGWPGALLAQQLLRHKTSKSVFVTVFWATVLLNLLGLYVVQQSMAAKLGH